MKKYFFVLVCLFLMIPAAKAENWYTTFEYAQKVALETDKLILVDFWANWCGPCKMMDDESWSSQEVKVLMNNFIPVKIDVDNNQSFAQKYNVESIPYVFIMDANGKIIHQEMSYMTKVQLITLLKKYIINTSFLKQDLINYYNNENFASAFRLVSKYQDLSMLVEKNIRHQIMGVADAYFSVSEKLLKNGDLKNKTTYFQTLELFEIKKFIILNNSKKASKLLDKLNERNLDSTNLSFFNLLKYLVCMTNNDLDTAKSWSEKLSENEKIKANVLLKNI